MNWNREKLIASLRYPGDFMTTDTLREALHHYDDIKPELHEALKLSPNEVATLESPEGEEYELKFFALFLAAEKRDADAFPLILNYFTNYNDQAWQSLGNICPTDVGRILASVCYADVNTLKATIDNDQLIEFLRLACLDALGVLLRTGNVSRQKLVEWFRKWLNNDALNQMERTWLVDVCLFLVIHEMKEDLLIALKSGRIDNDDLTRKDIEYMLSLPEIHELNRHKFSFIDDAIASISECSTRNYYPVIRTMFKGNELPVFMPFLSIHGAATEKSKFLPEFLHGFMFGMVLTPGLIMPGEWHPHLFGDEIPSFASDKDAEVAQSGLVLFYNRLNDELLDGMLTSPFGRVDSISKDLTYTARQWCRGIYHAMKLRPDYWLPKTGAPDFLDAITTITAFGDDGRANDLLKSYGVKPSASGRKEIWNQCRLKLPDAIEILLKYAQPVADDWSPQMPVQSNKVGRNAPCPCGSGKKFKKCCGAPGRSVHE